MSKQLFILSTATNDVSFPVLGKTGPGQAPRIESQFVVRGKAGLPNRHLWTPRGVSTPATSEQVDALRQHKVFQRMEANGWLTVVNADPRDADKIAAQQAEGDGSKLLTEGELKKRGKAAAPASKG